MLPRLNMKTTALLVLCVVSVAPAAERTLPGTQPLQTTNDLSREMVAGIDRFLMRENTAAVSQRSNYWRRDFSSPAAYERSVQENRERFQMIIGAVDERLPVAALEFVGGSTSQSSLTAETDSYAIHAVRWPVFAGVHGEGLFVRPKTGTKARVVALPDADQTPEMLLGLAPGIPTASQYARRFAESGCEVIIPTLIDRRDTWSGNARLKRFTNQPHREWIYRQAYELGRHVIGYEVAKVQGAVDYLARDGKPVGVIGYGEGALVAFYTAAVDPRIQVTAISGYFDSRQRLWEEPIYRNVFNLLTEFGDAEIASLIAPRTLIVEHSEPPKVEGPPASRQGRCGSRKDCDAGLQRCRWGGASRACPHATSELADSIDSRQRRFFDAGWFGAVRERVPAWTGHGCRTRAKRAGGFAQGFLTRRT